LSATVTVRDEGAVRVITLARPPGNALGRAELEALRREFQSASADPGVRALVVESGVPRYFSSGMDLAEITALPPERRAEPFGELLAAYRALLEAPKPVVAAASGAAILGGWILAMGCDWRVMAAESGKAALSEIRAGLSPTPLLIARLAALCRDPRVAREMVLRGETLRTDEALAAGLVDEVGAEAEVRARALDLARRLAKSPPAAFASVKRALNAPFLDASLWRESMEEFKATVLGPEAGEGMAALRDKRRPRWDA
jgi:enoyl-CoA hydratase/carnithine racemase